MIDDNWDLINGEDAHAIEVLNYSNQINVIEALVRLLMHHHCGQDGSCTESPNDRTLMEFHRTATLFLLHAPGAYRTEDVVVKKADGTVVHTPPQFAEVPQRMEGFFQMLGQRWLQSTPQEIAAYCLWMINWIHPFKNGNGRTARAFSYACLSLKIGFPLPGSPTVIDQIMSQREGYQQALKAADQAYESDGSIAHPEMTAFIDRLLSVQLSSF